MIAPAQWSAGDAVSVMLGEERNWEHYNGRILNFWGDGRAHVEIQAGERSGTIKRYFALDRLHPPIDGLPIPAPLVKHDPTRNPLHARKQIDAADYRMAAAHTPGDVRAADREMARAILMDDLCNEHCE